MKLQRNLLGLAASGFLLLVNFAGVEPVQRLTPLAFEHAQSILQRPDGQFDVTCIDGLTEVRTRNEILANSLCTHLKTFSGRWALVEGGLDNGSRFCDLNMDVVRSNDTILKLRAGFAAPCGGDVNETQQCSGLNCSMPLNGRYFSFDFSNGGRATLTRLDDGLIAVFEGNGGAGSGSTGTARLVDLSGVPNILQTTQDGGATWKSVCDDGFNQQAAEVACRELGFNGVVRIVKTSILVSTDADFGLDDLVCQGTEMSLNDCRHAQWQNENCGPAEHVQLTCGN